MISGAHDVFKVNVAKKCVSRFWGLPGGFKFWGTKILVQFKNYVFLYLAMRYPQYAKEITRKSIQHFP